MCSDYDYLTMLTSCCASCSLAGVRHEDGGKYDLDTLIQHECEASSYYQYKCAFTCSDYADPNFGAVCIRYSCDQDNHVVAVVDGNSYPCSDGYADDGVNWKIVCPLADDLCAIRNYNQNIGSVPYISSMSPTTGIRNLQFINFEFTHSKKIQIHKLKLGSESGGTEIHIYGRNFGTACNDSVIYIGNSRATDVSVLTDALITCVTPPGSGDATVTIQFASGETISALMAFEYDPLLSYGNEEDQLPLMVILNTTVMIILLFIQHQTGSSVLG